MNLRPVPPVSFETCESVARFVGHFEDTPPSKGLTRVAFPLMAALLPRVGYTEECAPEEIIDHLDNKGQVYLLPDHKERMDIPVHTAAAYRGRATQRILTEGLDIESQPENFDVRPFGSEMLRDVIATPLRELG